MKLLKFNHFTGIFFFILTVGLHASTDLKKVVMQLDWIFNAQFAGLYQAVEQGYFAEAGLEVEIRPANPALQTVDQVLAEPGLRFGCAESNVLLHAHASGKPIRALATMFQESPIGWMYLQGRGINSLEDLAGKRIGIHQDGEKILSVVTQNLDVDVADFQLPKIGYDVGHLLDGTVDAMQGYMIDEFVKLQLQTGGNGGFIAAKDLGYVAYSQVIFTAATTVEEHPDEVRAFLKAVQKGWEYALDHPEETVDLILRQYNPSLDRRYQLGSLQQMDSLVRPRGVRPLAPLRQEVFARSMEMYLQHGLIEGPTDLEALLDLRFNP